MALAAQTLGMFAVGPLLGHVRDLAPGAEEVAAPWHRAGAPTVGGGGLILLLWSYLLMLSVYVGAQVRIRLWAEPDRRTGSAASPPPVVAGPPTAPSRAVDAVN